MFNSAAEKKDKMTQISILTLKVNFEQLKRILQELFFQDFKKQPKSKNQGTLQVRKQKESI